MWDHDEDDLEDTNQEEEKFEDNSKMSGEKLDDEMRTKDDQENDNGEQGKQDPEQHKDNQNAPNESNENDADEKENINDDTDDKYEESHGVDVRDEQNEEDCTNEDDLDIDLNEGLNIENGEDDETGDQREDEASDVDRTDDIPDDVDLMDENDGDGTDEDGPEETEEADAIDVLGQGGNNNNTEDQDQQDDSNDDELQAEHSAKNQSETQDELHGVAAPDGEDAVKEKYDEGQDEDVNEDGGVEEMASGGADENLGESSQDSGGNGNDGSWQSGQTKEQDKSQANSERDEVPNPFRNPGDVEKFWHKKLDIINDDPAPDDPNPPDTSGQEQQQYEQMDQDGVFEYSKEKEDSNGQVLGAAEEEQAKQLQDNEDDEFQPNERNEEKADLEMEDRDEISKHNKPKSSNTDAIEKPATDDQPEPQKDNPMDEKDTKAAEDDIEKVETPKSSDKKPASHDAPLSSNRMPSEVSDVEDMDESNDAIEEVEITTQLNTLDIHESRVYWQTIQSETNNLSRRLCEKLRLVMEPLVATKLRGDYRTGKRVNMKRIIGYIASGYRKDKIWLRRTKPAKRDYRILIAVDDSESMQKSQAGDMALRALATLANGMSQLEIGQLGIASFGEEMKLIHPFNLPFTSESGVNVVSNFTFGQKRTRTALCVESSIAALESVESISSSMQLVFMISDGRIERDSRSKLRRLIRQMSEENMLMVMIIVEGDEGNDPAKKDKESILNMKEVSFVKGKPHIKHFIEDYPFPYYLVVNDLTSLPEILGDALRQWFEMMAQIQNGV